MLFPHTMNAVASKILSVAEQNAACYENNGSGPEEENELSLCEACG